MARRTVKKAKVGKAKAAKTARKRTLSIAKAKSVTKTRAPKKVGRIISASSSSSLLHAARVKANQKTSNSTQTYQPSDREVSPQGLPFSYNVTKLVLMPRDPYWIYGYWDFSSETWRSIEQIVKAEGWVRAVLRVYDVTGLKFNGLNSHRFFDVDITLEARDWYVSVDANREWISDLALIDAKGKYYLLARSNRVKTPRDAPSDEVDEEWMLPDFDEIYALSGGFGKGLSSGELKKMVESRTLVKNLMFSSHIVQPGLNH